MLKVKAIGAGQAGGGVADEFAKRDVEAMAVNSYQPDLDSHTSIKNKKLIGGRGSAQNREAVIDMVLQDLDGFKKDILDFVGDADLVFVSSSMVGTGSKLLPIILTIIKESQLKAIPVAIPIINHDDSSITEKSNAKDTYSELITVPCAQIYVSNEKALKKFGEKSSRVSAIYQRTNEQVAEDILDLIEAVATSSTYGNLDEAELLEAFSAVGMLRIDNLKDVNIKKVKDDFIKLKSNQIYPDLVDTLSQVSILIVEGTEELMSQYDEVDKNTLKRFAGMYKLSADRQIIQVKAGLKFPDQIFERFDEEVAAFNESKGEAIQSLGSSHFKSKSSKLLSRPESVVNSEGETDSGSQQSILGSFLSK